MNGDLKTSALSPDVPVHSFWHVYRRQFFLITLLGGLVLFLIWLPDGAVTALFTALFAQRLLIGLFLSFAFIAMSLVWTASEKLDTRIFMYFNRWSYHPKWLDFLMWLITQLGNAITAFILAVFFYFFYEHRLAMEIFFSTITLWLTVEAIKSLSDRARPYRTIEGTRIIGWREPGRSFPSGHTAQTFFMVTFLISRFQPTPIWTIVLYTAAAIVGFTRVYVGAHYPRDVVGGALIGSIWGILAMLIHPYWLWLNF